LEFYVRHIRGQPNQNYIHMKVKMFSGCQNVEHGEHLSTIQRSVIHIQSQVGLEVIFC